MTILDLSKWQGAVTQAAFSQMPATGIGRVIHKAGGSNAGTYVDSQYVGNVARARAAGLPLGHYWFNGAGNPVADAQFFVAHLSSYQDGDWLIVDTESYGPSMWTPAQVLAFAQEVKRLTGVTVIVYMSASVTRQFDWSAVVAFGCPLWVAAYQASAPPVSYWHEWIAWQFTSSGTVPGIPGRVDLSHEGTAKTATVPQSRPGESNMLLILHNTTQGDPDYDHYWAIDEMSGYEQLLPSSGYATLYSARYGVPIDDVPATELAWWHSRVQAVATARAEQAADHVWSRQLNGANGSHAAGDRLVGADLKAGTATAPAAVIPADLSSTMAHDVVAALATQLGKS